MDAAQDMACNQCVQASCWQPAPRLHSRLLTRSVESRFMDASRNSYNLLLDRAPISSPCLCMDINACIYFRPFAKERTFHTSPDFSRMYPVNSLKPTENPKITGGMRFLWNCLGMEVRKARRDLAFDVDAFQMVNDPKCDTHTGDTEISTIFADSPSSSKHRNRPLKGDVHLRSIYPGHMFFDEWVVFG